MVSILQLTCTQPHSKAAAAAAAALAPKHTKLVCVWCVVDGAYIARQPWALCAAQHCKLRV